MTSVDEGWAGGKRGTSDHGLPSLVNRVSDQTAPTQLENGDDERILDRMGAQQRTDSCRETAEIVQKREAWELGWGGVFSSSTKSIVPQFAFEYVCARVCVACGSPCLTATRSVSLSCWCLYHHTARSSCFCSPSFHPCQLSSVAPHLLSLPASATGASHAVQHHSDGNGINWKSG